MNGFMLPLQIIFEGKTELSLPRDAALKKRMANIGHHLALSDNHWSSQKTMREYFAKILKPYIDRTIKEMNVQVDLPADQHAVVLLDCWSVHTSDEFRTHIKEHYPNIHLLYIPGGTTGLFQPADVAINRPFKHHFKKEFMLWAHVYRVRWCMPLKLARPLRMCLLILERRLA